MSFVYGWPADLSSQVVAKRTRERSAGDDRRVGVLTATYQLSTEPQGSNTRVLGSEVSLALEPNPSLPRSDFSALLAQMTTLTPDIVISPSGEFLGLYDLPGYRSRVQALLAKTMPNHLAPDLMPSIKRAISSEATLLANGADWWNGLVGSWLEAEMDVGAVYRHSERAPHPMVPGEQVLTHYEFKVDRVFPCKRRTLAVTCAEIALHVESDESDARRIMEGFVDKLAADSNEDRPVFRELYTENRVKLVTEPSGLIPHSYLDSQIMRGTVVLRGTSQLLRQVETSEFWFSY